MKVLLAMPTINWIKDTYKKYKEMQYFINNMKPIPWVEVIHSTTTRVLIHAARNHFLEKMLKDKYNFIRFLDDDNPPDQLDSLQIMLGKIAQYKCDVVSWLVRLRNDYKKLNISKVINDKKIWNKPRFIPYEKLKKDKFVNSCWCACVLMTNHICYDMLNTFKRPFENKVTEYLKMKDWTRQELNYNLLNYIKEVDREDEDHRMIYWHSEDHLFCERARKKWYKILATPDVTCTHIKYENWKKILIPYKL